MSGQRIETIDSLLFGCANSVAIARSTCTTDKQHEPQLSYKRGRLHKPNSHSLNIFEMPDEIVANVLEYYLDRSSESNCLTTMLTIHPSSYRLLCLSNQLSFWKELRFSFLSIISRWLPRDIHAIAACNEGVSSCEKLILTPDLDTKGAYVVFLREVVPLLRNVQELVLDNSVGERDWKGFIEAFTKLKTLKVHYPAPPKPFPMKLLSSFKELRHLSLTNCLLESPEKSWPRSLLEVLEHISFHRCYGDIEGALMCIGVHAVNLHTLKLADMQVPDSVLSRLRSRSHCRFESVKCLSIHNVELMSAIGLQEMVAMCPSLTSVDLWASSYQSLDLSVGGVARSGSSRSHTQDRVAAFVEHSVLDVLSSFSKTAISGSISKGGDSEVATGTVDMMAMVMTYMDVCVDAVLNAGLPLTQLTDIRCRGPYLSDKGVWTIAQSCPKLQSLCIEATTLVTLSATRTDVFDDRTSSSDSATCAVVYGDRASLEDMSPTGFETEPSIPMDSEASGAVVDAVTDHSYTDALAVLPTSCVHLHTLTVVQCPRVPPVSLAALTQRMHNLRSLSLDGVVGQLEADMVVQAMCSVRRNPQLSDSPLQLVSASRCLSVSGAEYYYRQAVRRLPPHMQCVAPQLRFTKKSERRHVTST